MQTTVISFSNHKGGTGKTTSTLNIACVLRDAGKSVLIIDLDPQANLTYSVGLGSVKNGIREVLLGDNTIADVIHYTQSLAVLPMANSNQIDDDFLANEQNYFLLSEKLAGLHYDYILIDCPPATGKLTKLALVASNYVIIPMLMEVLSIQGLDQILHFVQQLQITYNSNLEVLGVLAVCVNASRKLTTEVLEYIQQHYQVNVFNNRVHNNVKAAEAPSFAKSVVDYAPESTSAKDYKAVGNELLNLLQYTQTQEYLTNQSTI